MKKLILLFLMLFLINSVSAATISGTIYEWNTRNPVDAYVEVNSIPAQGMLAVNGEYSFELEPGIYTLKVTVFRDLGNLVVEREVVIEREGNFNLDIILFEDLVEEEQDSNLIIILAVFIVAVLIILFYIRRRKKRKVESKEDALENGLDKIMKIIKKHGGRATQKEIRKELPLSEAKVSLMISELEDKGVVKRIKKGRGNIIVLVKK